MSWDVIIIGAGAAGMMCAAVAGQRGRRVLLLDHAKKPGEKVRISGGGRCNFTNMHSMPANFLSQNPHFMKSALKRYRPQDFIALVERYGIAYHEKTLGQLFCDGSSQQIIDMLLQECEKAQVELKLDTHVERVEFRDDLFQIATNRGEFSAPALVIATGGKSIPKMGATGFGYDIARQFGLNIVTPRAGLVPLTFTGEIATSLASLSGVSVDAVVTCNGARFREGLLFTHRGLSGPSILQISSYWREGDEIAVNLAPDISLFDELKAKRKSDGKKTLASHLHNYLPKRVIEFLGDNEVQKMRLADVSDKQLRGEVERFQSWKITPQGSEGYRTAEVTLGGIDTAELSSKTMESAKQKGLYFIGEVVDVTGHLGGHNFQWAWASAVAAGNAL
ncbi:MAG: NAD(P)/FAD-dependent oxidoreductase [Sphingomonadales bacterium]